MNGGTLLLTQSNHRKISAQHCVQPTRSASLRARLTLAVGPLVELILKTTMTDGLAEYKHRMGNSPNDGELNIVDNLLAHPPDEFDAVLKWIFVEHKGYVEPRARAGLKFVQRNPVEGLTVIEQLIGSSDPDDRDAAVTVLERYGQASVFHLAKPLLIDRYPYLRFEAIELLGDIYPEEVKASLRELAEHETEKWVREAAQNQLRKMKESA